MQFLKETQQKISSIPTHHKKQGDIRQLLKQCRLCPRNCGADRLSGQTGFCGAGGNLKAARAALHFWEEPCLSGKNGSGAVFFSHCSLRCVYCQNNAISMQGDGQELTISRLCDIFLTLQKQGANNINLVSPTHYALHIIQALSMAKSKGLHLPVIYNSSGYESLQTLQMLRGFVDIYLPDLKYFASAYSARYSDAADYFKTAAIAVTEMVRQTGKPQYRTYRGDAILVKGTIIRHLALPGLLFDSKKVLDFIHQSFHDKVLVSIMNQYTPMPQLARQYSELDRTLPPGHYRALCEYAAKLGIHGFVQQEGTVGQSFIPAFNGQGIL